MIQTKCQVLAESRLCQGDLLRDVPFVERVAEGGGEVEISTVFFPLVVILSQDCDLERDAEYREAERDDHDKWLLSVLAAPVYNAEHVYSGEHLSDLGRTMKKIPKSKTTAGHIRNNEIPRYHYMEFEAGLHLPPGIVDFKHYFGVPVEEAHGFRREKYIASLSPLFRESLSQRFSNYLSRIGLPEAEPLES